MKLLGYSIFGLMLATMLILFAAGAAKICLFLYKSMSISKAVLVVCVVAVLFGWLVGVGGEGKRR